MVGRQRNDVYATVVEQRAGTYQQRINRLLDKPRKGRINVTAGGGLDDFDLLPDGQRRSLNVRDKGLGGGEVGIDQHANAHGSRLQLMQQSKLLCPKYLFRNLAQWEPVERQRHQLCVSETSSAAPSIEAQLISSACRRSCDRACGASRFGSSQSTRTWQPSWPWPRRGSRRLSPARSSWRTTSVPDLAVWVHASQLFHPRLSWAGVR